MNTYNKWMLKFWLVVSIVLPLVVTYLVITDTNGFERWGSYYILAIFTFVMYLVRRFMMKKMQKHLDYLKNNQKG
jgi:hypothetical protein